MSHKKQIHEENITDILGLFANSYLMFPFLLGRHNNNTPREPQNPIRNTKDLVGIPFKLDQEYAKKWNETCNDFIHLYDANGKKLSDTLYRVGGFGGNMKDGYVELLKYTEAFYEDSITKDPKRKPHLQSKWCIVDKNGVEKVVQGQTLRHPHHVGGVIYALESKYYNLETGEFYCESHSCQKSDDFIFLENQYSHLYDKTNPRELGVYKINKWDGTFEIFKITK